MKNFLIFIIIIFISNLLVSQPVTGEPDKPDNSTDQNQTLSRINDKGKFKTLSEYDITRILFWSNYGVTGFTALVNTFAHLGYSYSISQEITSISNKIKDYHEDPGILPQFASYYPAFMFGFHFISSGLAFIPTGGGIAYGTLLFSIGTAFSVVRAITMNPFELKFDDSDIPDEYKDNLSMELDKAWEIYNKIFDPTPYFVVGGISILFGIGEIVTTLFYIKERNKKRYPYMQKIFSFSPTSFCITIKFNT